MAKFTSFLLIAGGRILQAFDTAAEAEAGVVKYGSPLDIGDMYIAEVIQVYKRKVTYDSVPVD